MQTGIRENPLLALLPEVKDAATKRPDDNSTATTWTAVQSLIAFVRGLLGLLEFHVETITNTPTPPRIPHRLGRKPFGRIILWQTQNANPRSILYDIPEQWTKEHIRMNIEDGSVTICFVLF